MVFLAYIFFLLCVVHKSNSPYHGLALDFKLFMVFVKMHEKRFGVVSCLIEILLPFSCTYVNVLALRIDLSRFRAQTNRYQSVIPSAFNLESLVAFLYCTNVVYAI